EKHLHRVHAVRVQPLTLIPLGGRLASATPSQPINSGRAPPAPKGGTAMRLSSVQSFACALLLATALTPARAADMTYERSLNVGSEPQNWVLHHGNYQGHRFSTLKEINAANVKNLKVAFTLGLGGIEGAGVRHKSGNLEATPLVEDGVMYVPDGWGSVYA